MILFLSSACVVTAHPGHGEPIEVPSEPTEPDTGTTDTSDTSTTSPDTRTITTTSTGSGSTETESGHTESATPTSSDAGSENAGEVAIYNGGDSEAMNSSWPIAALFGVAAVLGVVGVYFKGDRLGL